MKIYLSLLLLATIIYTGCTRDRNENIAASLEGTWKMTAVKDRTTGSVANKPASLSGDVVVSFAGVGSSGGTVQGNTPSNTFGPNPFSIGSGATLSIPNLSMTKVAETSWGRYFVEHIRNAESYDFQERDGLTISTAQKILSFTKR